MTKSLTFEMGRSDYQDGYYRRPDCPIERAHYEAGREYQHEVDRLNYRRSLVILRTAGYAR
jgi:hypothetical protein